MSAIRLSDFVNAANIGGADSPHVVVEKLQAAIDQASPSPSREADRVGGDLRWALAALDLVANGLRSCYAMDSTNVEMINLNAAKVSIEHALKSPEPGPSFAAPQDRVAGDDRQSLSSGATSRSTPSGESPAVAAPAS